MAVIASGINSGSGFGSSDAVTSTNLNNHVNAATFVAGGSGSTDDNTLEVHTDGKLRAKDSSSKTTGITFAKMQHISTAKVLGRSSSGEGDVEEAFDFKDEDDMSSNSATAIPSQQSVKAYVDGSSTPFNTTDLHIPLTSGRGFYYDLTSGAITANAGSYLPLNGQTISDTSATMEFHFQVGVHLKSSGVIFHTQIPVGFKVTHIKVGVNTARSSQGATDYIELSAGEINGTTGALTHKISSGSTNYFKLLDTVDGDNTITTELNEGHITGSATNSLGIILKQAGGPQSSLNIVFDLFQVIAVLATV